MRRDSQPGHVTTRAYTCVRSACGCGCASVPSLCTTTLQMRLVIYVYVGAGANPHSCVRMHVHVQGMDRRSRASLPLLRPPRSFLLITPLVSRFLPLLSPPSPSLPSHSPSFLSLFLSPSFYDPRSALPPTRLVRTIGVSTLETLHAWHTCKRARKSTQYRYRCADTEQSARKPVRTRYDLSSTGASRGDDAEKIERKMYPFSMFIDSS